MIANGFPVAGNAQLASPYSVSALGDMPIPQPFISLDLWDHCEGTMDRYLPCR
jgi:hypothetical protein